MAVTNWNTVSADASDYSKYWDSPAKFQPQQFSSNAGQEDKWNDPFWAIAFLINFAATIICLICVWPDFDKPSESTLASIDLGRVWKGLGLGIVLAIAFNAIHYAIATFAPLFYIKTGFILGTVVSVLCAIWSIFSCSGLFVIFPIITIVLAIVMYCMCRKYFGLSAAVLQQATKLICEIPSIVFVGVGEAIVNTVVTFIYALAIYAVEYTGTSRGIYLYLLFSYFWVTITLSYVGYTTVAGVAADWYFLNGTEYFPANPVFASLKRACTTSFGSCCLAGLLLAVVEFLKSLIESRQDNSGSDGLGIFIAIVKCVALCILRIIECMIQWITRYALIYCAMFGIPFREGCRRWTELSCKKFVGVIMAGNCTSRVLTFNELVWTVASAIIGYAIGYTTQGTENEKIWIGAMTCVFACLFTFTIFVSLADPLLVVSDTLLVCFAEAPENLHTTASELYDKLVEYYGEALGQMKA